MALFAPNIGPRSIVNSTVGLNVPNYDTLMNRAIASGTGTGAGEQVFCGPVDDPFFVDLGGAFDVGNLRPEFNANNNNTVNPPKDGLARYNVHSIAIKIPISTLSVGNITTTQATSILDDRFIIGVWASASRQQIKTISSGAASFSGNWVQVSRLGMPLANEAVIPIGSKDRYNTVMSNSPADTTFGRFFKNPELALYMDNSQFGSAVPALNALRIQSSSLQKYDFRNGKKGLYGVRFNTLLTTGTAFAESPGYGAVLLPDSVSPRAVDLLPIFMTGVPNFEALPVSYR